ncbi:hypothetical protein [Streptomyces chartreusis]
MSLVPWRRRNVRAQSSGAGNEATYPLALRGERMASSLSGALFTVRINGAWRWTRTGPLDHHNPAAVARDHLRRQTAGVLRRHSVLNLSAALDAANAVAGTWSHPADGLETAGAVHVDVAAHDRGLAEEHARRQQTTTMAQEAELQRLAHLQHILAHPDLLRVWWIAQFPERFNELTALASALQGLPPPHEAEEDDIRADIRRFTDHLVTDLHTPQQREVFLTALIQTLHALGHTELAKAATPFQSPPATGSATA